MDPHSYYSASFWATQKTLLHGTLGPLKPIQHLTHPHLLGFTIFHLNNEQTPSLPGRLYVHLCLYTIHLWPDLQVTQPFIPEAPKSNKGIEPEQRFNSHFPDSGCKLSKDRHMKFVKIKNNEGINVFPELKVRGSLEEGCSVRVCGWLTWQTCMFTTVVEFYARISLKISVILFSEGPVKMDVEWGQCWWLDHCRGAFILAGTSSQSLSQRLLWGSLWSFNLIDLFLELTLTSKTIRSHSS